MRRVERLITQVRRQTDNEEFDNDPNNPLGITTQELTEYLQDAQKNMQASISAVHPKVFVKTTTIDLVADTESYALPSDLFLGGRIIAVEAKFSEQARDYTALKPRHIKTRLPDVKTEIAEAYIRLGSNLLVQPVPSRAWTNGLRITYQAKVLDIGFRLGQIAAVQTSGGFVTRIDLEASPTKAQDSDLPTIASNYVTQFDEVSVVTKFGINTAKAIPVSTFDEDNGYILLEASHALASGESITVGDYIVGGGNSTTHSELPDTCERYLIAYAAWKVLKADSMIDSRDQERELVAMLSEIVAAFKEIDEDQIELVLDEDWII